MAHKPGVLKSNGRPVQASSQPDGEKLLVPSQNGAYLVCLNKLFQTRERVVCVADDVGSSRNSRVELVVPRGQVYFESEESLSKFYTSNMEGSHKTSKCQNGRVQLIHSHVEAVFASAVELGSYVNKFCTTIRPTN